MSPTSSASSTGSITPIALSPAGPLSLGGRRHRSSAQAASERADKAERLAAASGLRLDLEGIRAMTSPPMAQSMVRKKSGEIVRSSMKYGPDGGYSGQSSASGGDSGPSSAKFGAGSRSLPTTPSCPKVSSSSWLRCCDPFC